MDKRKRAVFLVKTKPKPKLPLRFLYPPDVKSGVKRLKLVINFVTALLQKIPNTLL